MRVRGELQDDATRLWRRSYRFALLRTVRQNGIGSNTEKMSGGISCSTLCAEECGAGLGREGLDNPCDGQVCCCVAT